MNCTRTFERPADRVTLILALSGEYDFSTAEALGGEFMLLLEEPGAIVVDLRDVQYIDSQSFTQLVHFHNARTTAGFSPLAVIVEGNSLVRRTLEITGLAQIFDVLAAADQPKEAHVRRLRAHGDRLLRILGEGNRD